jgi:hypothetical protein
MKQDTYDNKIRKTGEHSYAVSLQLNFILSFL